MVMVKLAVSLQETFSIPLTNNMLVEILLNIQTIGYKCEEWLKFKS